MSQFNVKIYNSDLEVYEWNVNASSEAVARMRALTMYNHICTRFTIVTKVKVSERKRGF